MSNQFWVSSKALAAKVSRVRAGIVAIALLSLVAAGAATAVAPAASAPVQAVDERPNIVFILADDLDRKVLEFMPNVKTLLADEGATFENFIYNIALCCPSRATLLRGQYAHNTGVFGNLSTDGGYAKFLGNGNETSTLPVWLQSAGYVTGYYGKYFNGYPEGGGVPPSHVPPGWDDWFVATSAYDGYTYRVSNNGGIKKYGSAPADYVGDIIADDAIDFLEQNESSVAPFYMNIATFAPHHPFVPAPRHTQLFPGIVYPKTPNFNEADVSDKPMRPRLITPTEIAGIDKTFRKRVQAAQSVDETVAAVVSTLQAQGELDNTYIAFASDNGFHLGEHRISPVVGGKHTPYEEDIRVPLIIRGPGLTPGTTYPELVGNVDIAPTFAELAGATTPRFVDGRSFLPVIQGDAAQWRQSYLMQRGSVDVTPYHGLRTDRYTYVEYDGGFRELYDLQVDPYQLRNIHASAPAALKTALKQRLAALKGCTADVCRSAEVVPVPE